MPSTIMAFGRYRIDLARYEFTSDQDLVALPPLVFRLLTYLSSNRMRPVSQEEILAEVWGGTAVGHSAVAQAVKQAHQAVGDSGREQKVIKTIRGFGYRFVADIKESVEQSDNPDRVFVGREHLVGELESLVDRSISGHGAIVLLSGEAGLGKTRLCLELAKHAVAQGVLVARGAGIAQAGTPPYWPWIGVFRDLSIARPIHELSEEIRKSAPQLIDPSVVPEHGQDALGEDVTRFRIFDSASRCLRQASEISPLLLIMDDVHDAGGSTLELLEFIARGLHATPILVVATYRRAEALRDEGIAAGLARIAQLPLAYSQSLAPLGEEETTRLITSLSNEIMSPEIAIELARRSGGNPFYAVELARFIRSEFEVEAGSREGGRLEERLPRSVQQLMAERLGSLPLATRRILRSAAALGGQLDSELLREVEPASDVPRAIKEGCVAGLLLEADADRRWFRFSHELIREALYSELSSDLEERQRVHLRIAEAMTQRDSEHVIEIAFHLTVAAPRGGVARTIEALHRAGAHAKSVFDDEQSWLLYQQALRLIERWSLDDDSLRFDILVAAGEMAVRGARLDQARGELGEAVQIARERGWAERFGRAALAYSYRPEIVGTSEDEFVELLEEALEMLGASAPSMRARLLSRLSIEMRYRSDRGLERALKLGNQAIETARGTTDAAALARTLEDASAVRWSGKDPEGWIDPNRQIVRAAIQARNTDLDFLGTKGLATILREWEEAEQMFSAADSMHAHLSAYPWQVRTGIARASLCSARGERDRALQLIEKWAPEAEALGMMALAKKAADIRSTG